MIDDEDDDDVIEIVRPPPVPLPDADSRHRFGHPHFCFGRSLSGSCDLAGRSRRRFYKGGLRTLPGGTNMRPDFYHLAQPVLSQMRRARFKGEGTTSQPKSRQFGQWTAISSLTCSALMHLPRRSARRLSYRRRRRPRRSG